MARKISTSGDWSYQDIINHAKRESINQGVEMYTPSAVAPTSGTLNFGTNTLVPTEVFIAEAVTMTVGKGGATINVQYYSGPSNVSVGEKVHRAYCKDNSVTLPLREVFTAGSAMSAGLRDGDGTTALTACVNLSGYYVTADLNYNAEKVALFIGDSIMRGTTMGSTPYTSYATILNATRPEAHFAFQVRNHFQQRGEDLRIVIKAMGSYSAREMGFFLDAGWLDIPQADIIFYQLGVNDTTKGTTNPQFQAELDRVVAWRNRVFPDSKLVFVGATPLNNSTNETTLSGFRSLAAAMANPAQNIYYFSLATSFDRTVLTNYTSSDGVHPNIATNVLVANGYKTWIDANDIKI